MTKKLTTSKRATTEQHHRKKTIEAEKKDRRKILDEFNYIRFRIDDNEKEQANKKLNFLMEEGIRRAFEKMKG